MIQFNQNKMPYIDQYGGWLEDIEAYFAPARSQTIISSDDSSTSDPFDLIPSQENTQQTIRVAPSTIQESWFNKLEDLFGYGGYGQASSPTLSPTVTAILAIGGIAALGYFMFFRKMQFER